MKYDASSGRIYKIAPLSRTGKPYNFNVVGGPWTLEEARQVAARMSATIGGQYAPIIREKRFKPVAKKESL